MNSSIHSLVIALAAWALTSCLNLGDDTQPPPVNPGETTHWSGSLSSTCEGGNPQWIARFDPDSTVSSDSGRYTVVLNVPLDSLTEGTVFQQERISIQVDSLDSGFVWGTFEIRAEADSPVVEHFGRLSLRLVPPAVPCQTNLACEDALPPIQMEGEWTWNLPPSELEKEWRWIRMGAPPQHSQLSTVWAGEWMVAVGTGGWVETSQDGEKWAQQTSGTTHTLRAVACAPLGIVAVGDAGTVLISPDGKTWSPETSGTESPLQALIWTGTQFVVVGHNGVILTSPDGSAWMTRLSGTPLGLLGVATSGERIVAVGDSGLILSSLDGSTWTRRREPGAGASLIGVVWTGKRFLAYTQDALLESPDGSTWTTAPSTDPRAFRKIRRIGSQVAGVARRDPFTHDIIHVSTDSGTTWLSSSSVPVIGARDVVWTREKLVIVGGGHIRALP